MPDTILGLPLHPLIIHATVVIVPSAAVAVLLAALWPRFRAWAGWAPLALSVAAVALAPLSTSTGEGLEKIVGESELVERHAELGDQLLFWVIPLAVLAAAGYWFNTFRGGRQPNRALNIVLTILSIIAALGVLVMVVLIGHSGAEAVWSDAAASGTIASSHLLT